MFYPLVIYSTLVTQPIPNIHHHNIIDSIPAESKVLYVSIPEHSKSSWPQSKSSFDRPVYIDDIIQRDIERLMYKGVGEEPTDK